MLRKLKPFEIGPPLRRGRGLHHRAQALPTLVGGMHSNESLQIDSSLQPWTPVVGTGL
jgi:hypothetical protein